MKKIIDPSLWKPKLRWFATEALRNQHLHKARARSLVEHGLAVLIDNRCVLTLNVHDALIDWLRKQRKGTKT